MKKTINIIALAVLSFTVLLPVSVHSQTQQIKVEVSPTIGNSIKGHLELDRKKYINLSTNVKEVDKVMTTDRFERYINDYEMTIGRALGMVHSETRWGSSLREDPNRPGFIDTAYMAQKLSPNDAGLQKYMSVFGSTQGLAMHDRGGSHESNTYPSFMPMYTKDDGHSYFPENNEAHAEMAAHLMMEKYTDFQRPDYFELVNEPSWQYSGDQRFFDFHTFTKRKFDTMNIPTEVGGPCSSVGYYYKKNFESMNGFTSFIDGTNCELDFYSYHIYDYLHWDANKKNFTGSITSGLPTEAVFDALSAYTLNKYGKEFTYVGSEHGGYNGDDANRRTAADYLSTTYFPYSQFGSYFQWEMERRSIDNFLLVNSSIANTLTFMNHPHVVKKAVPFILSETSGWDPTYYSSLLVKENFDKNSAKWVESDLIHFYQFFNDVKGRRVKAICNDNDIQHFSFVNGNELIMVFHNQSDVDGQIDIAIDELDVDITKMMIRRLGRQEDFRPYFREEALNSLKKIEIGGQESLVVFATYNQAIPHETTIDTRPFYSTESAVKFTGSKDFSVKIDDPHKVDYAVLRVGIGRQSTSSSAKAVNIFLNGTKLDIPVENSADRLTNISYNTDGSVNTGNSSYATTRMVKIDPALLVEDNSVKVEFADGGEGGVGAVVIRAAYFEPYYGVDKVEIISEKKSKPNKTFALSAKVYPYEAADKSITWKSTSTDIASVNNEGVVTTYKLGKTQIIVTSNVDSKTDTCFLEVTNDAPIVWADEIIISPTSLNFLMMEQASLSVTVLPSDADNTSVMWESRNPNIASVNEDGVVYGESPGVTYLIAKNESAKDSILVNILPLPNSVSCDSFPSRFPSDSVITFKVPYTLGVERDIAVEFYKSGANFNWIADGVATFQPGKGVTEITVRARDKETGESLFPPKGKYTMYAATRDVGMGAETNKNKCLKSITITDRVVNSIEKNILNDVSIFPNPTHGILNISGNLTVVNTIHIYDLQGQLVKVFQQPETQSLNISELERSTYILKIESKSGTFTHKLIKL